MNEDADLLREFVVRRDQASFRQLVERRIGLVYAVNLRRLGDAHLAQDATQAVFIALARKAESVAGCPSVVGWLHRSSCYESRNMIRARSNRTAREVEAQRLGTAAPASAPAVDAEAVGVVLDEVLNELPDADRVVILARYFSGQSYPEIGAATDLTENAARMRVERALEKLREGLRRRGFDSTAAVLAGILPAYATAAVPGGLAAAAANAAFSTLGASGVAALVTSMNATKITLAAVGVLGVIGFAGFEAHRASALQDELGALRQEVTRSAEQLRTLEKQISAAKAAPAAGPAAPVAPTAGSAAAAVAATEPVEIPGITRTAPEGWHKNGSKPGAFDVGVDATELWGGMPSAYVRSISADAKGEFAGMMQTTAADLYRGQRVRMSGSVKTKEAADGGQLWLRVDGQVEGKALGFDNLNKRAPKGTTDWQEYSIVLDVPAEASSLNYGMFLGGTGQMWTNAVRIETVGADVPTTNMLNQPRQLPQQPVNLGFSPAPKPGGG